MELVYKFKIFKKSTILALTKCWSFDNCFFCCTWIAKIWAIFSGQVLNAIRRINGNFLYKSIIGVCLESKTIIIHWIVDEGLWH